MTNPNVSKQEPGPWGSNRGYGRAYVPAQRVRLMALFSAQPDPEHVAIKCNQCGRALGLVAKVDGLGYVAQWTEKNREREAAHIENGGHLTAVQEIDPKAPLEHKIPLPGDVVAIIGNHETNPILGGWCPRCRKSGRLRVHDLIGGRETGKTVRMKHT